MKLRVVLHPEEGGFIASCPAFTGCHSQGSTQEEASANIREAIRGCLAVRNERSASAVGQMVELEV